jgi:membrane-associated phospholipid phosphatase
VHARDHRLLAAAAAAVIACILLGVLADAGATAALDGAALKAGAAVRETPLGRTLEAWSLLGELVPSVGGTAALALVLVALRRSRAAVWLVLGAAAVGVSSLLKIVFSVPRPTGGAVLDAFGETYAYPSGHVVRIAVFAGVLLLIARRERFVTGDRTMLVLSAAAVVATVAMAAARVVSGEHWLSDVIGGALLAGGWLAATAWAWAAPTEPPAARHRA